MRGIWSFSTFLDSGLLLQLTPLREEHQARNFTVAFHLYYNTHSSAKGINIGGGSDSLQLVLLREGHHGKSIAELREKELQLPPLREGYPHCKKKYHASRLLQLTPLCDGHRFLTQ